MLEKNQKENIKISEKIRAKEINKINNDKKRKEAENEKDILLYKLLSFFVCSEGFR